MRLETLEEFWLPAPNRMDYEAFNNSSARGICRFFIIRALLVLEMV